MYFHPFLYCTKIYLFNFLKHNNFLDIALVSHLNQYSCGIFLFDISFLYLFLFLTNFCTLTTASFYLLYYGICLFQVSMIFIFYKISLSFLSFFYIYLFHIFLLFLFLLQTDFYTCYLLLLL